MEAAAGVGRDQKGAFCTAHHKEYPAGFSNSIAAAVCEQIKYDLNQRRLASFVPIAPMNLEWISEAASTGAAIRTGRDFLPDYQGVN